jgi:hypothetical protein
MCGSCGLPLPRIKLAAHQAEKYSECSTARTLATLILAQQQDELTRNPADVTQMADRQQLVSLRAQIANDKG